MFLHHVFFTLKNPNNAAERQQLIDGLNTLRGVQTIKLIHIGQPAATDRDVIDRLYSISWLLIFENLADEEVYQVHPLHLKFVENCKHLWSKVVVYDSVSAA